MPGTSLPDICLYGFRPTESGFILQLEKTKVPAQKAPIDGVVQVHLVGLTAASLALGGAEGATVTEALGRQHPATVARMAVTLDPEPSHLSRDEALAIANRLRVYLDLPGHPDLLHPVDDRFLPITVERGVPADLATATGVRVIPENHLVRDFTEPAGMSDLHYPAMRGQLRITSDTAEIGLPRVVVDALPIPTTEPPAGFTEPLPLHTYAELVSLLDGLAPGQMAKFTVTASGRTYTFVATMHESGLAVRDDNRLPASLPRRPESISVSLPAPAATVDRHARQKLDADQFLKAAAAAGQPEVLLPVGFDSLGGSPGTLGWGERGRLEKIGERPLTDPGMVAQMVIKHRPQMSSDPAEQLKINQDIRDGIQRRHKDLGAVEFGRRLTGIGLHLWVTRGGERSRLTVRWKLNGPSRSADGKLRPIPAAEVKKSLSGEIAGTSIDPGYHMSHRTTETTAKALGTKLPFGVRILQGTPYLPWVQVGADIFVSLKDVDSTFSEQAYTANLSMPLDGTTRYVPVFGELEFDYLPERSDVRETHTGGAGAAVLSFPAEQVDVQGGRTGTDFHVSLPAEPTDDQRRRMKAIISTAVPESIAGPQALAEKVVAALSLSENEVRNDIEDRFANESLTLQEFLNFVGPGAVSQDFEGGGKKFAIVVSGLPLEVRRVDERSDGVVKNDFRHNQQKGSGEGQGRSAGLAPYLRPNFGGALPVAAMIGLDLKANVSGKVSGGDTHSVTYAEGSTTWHITTETGPTAVYKVTTALKADVTSDAGPVAPVTFTGTMTVHVPLVDADRFERSLRSINEATGPVQLSTDPQDTDIRYLPAEIENGDSLGDGVVTGLPGLEEVIPEMLRLVGESGTRRSALEMIELQRKLGPLYDPNALRALQDLLYPHPGSNGANGAAADGDSDGFFYGLPFTVTWENKDGKVEVHHFLLSLRKRTAPSGAPPPLSSHSPPRQGFNLTFSGPTSAKEYADGRQNDRGLNLSALATVDLLRSPAAGAGRGPGRFGLLNVGVQGGHEQGWSGAQERRAGESSMRVGAVSHEGTMYPFWADVEAVIEVRSGTGSPLPSVLSAQVRVTVPEPFTRREPPAPDEAAAIGRISVVDTAASNDMGSRSPAGSGPERSQVPAGVTSLAPGDLVRGTLGGPALAGVLRRTPPTGMSQAAIDDLTLWLANPNWLVLVLAGLAAPEDGSGVTLTGTFSRLRPKGETGIPGRDWAVWERTVGSVLFDANGHTSASEVPAAGFIPIPNGIVIGTSAEPDGTQSLGLLPLPKRVVGHKSTQQGTVRSQVTSTGRWEERPATHDRYLVDVKWTMTVDGGKPVRISVTGVPVLRRSGPEVSGPPPRVPRSLDWSRIPVLSSTRRLEPLPDAGQPNQLNPVGQMVASLLKRNNLVGLIIEKWRGWGDPRSELKELSEFTELTWLQTMMPALLGAGVPLLSIDGKTVIVLRAYRRGSYKHADAEFDSTIIRFGAKTVTTEQSITNIDAHGWHFSSYGMQGFPNGTATSWRIHPDVLRILTGLTTSAAAHQEMDRKFLTYHAESSHVYKGSVEFVATLVTAEGYTLPSAFERASGLESQSRTEIGRATVREHVGASEDVLPDPAQATSAAPPPTVTLLEPFNLSRPDYSRADMNWFPVSVSDIRDGRVTVLEFDPDVVRALSAEIHEVLRTSSVNRFISDGIPAVDLLHILEQLAAPTVVEDAVGTGHSFETGRSEGLLKGEAGVIRIQYQFFNAALDGYLDVTRRTERGFKSKFSAGRQVQSTKRDEVESILSFATSSLPDRATDLPARDAVPVGIPNASLSRQLSKGSTAATSSLHASFSEQRGQHPLTMTSVLLRFQVTLGEKMLVDEGFRLDNAVSMVVDPETALANAPYFSPPGRPVETVFDDGIPTPAGRFFPAGDDAETYWAAAHAQQMFPSSVVVTGRYDPLTDRFSGQDVAGLSSRLAPLVGDSGLVVLPVGGVGDIRALHPVGGADPRHQRSFAARLAAQLERDAPEKNIRVIAPAHDDDVLQTPVTPDARPNPPGQLVAMRFSPVVEGAPPQEVAALGTFAEHSANGEFQPLDHDLTPAVLSREQNRGARPVGGQKSIPGARPPLGRFGWSARRPFPTDEESKMVAGWVTGKVVIGGAESDQAPERAGSMLPGVVQVYVRGGTPGELVFAALGLVAERAETGHMLRVLTVDGDGVTVQPDYDVGYRSSTGEFTAGSLFQKLADRHLIDVDVDNGHAEPKRLRPHKGLAEGPASDAEPVSQGSVTPGTPQPSGADLDAAVPAAGQRTGDSDLTSEPQWLRDSLARIKRPYEDTPNLLSDMAVLGLQKATLPPGALRSIASKRQGQYFVWLSTAAGDAVDRQVYEWLNERLEQLAQAGRTLIVVTRGRPTLDDVTGGSRLAPGPEKRSLDALLARYGVAVVHEVPQSSGGLHGLNVDNSWKVHGPTPATAHDGEADATWDKINASLVDAALRLTRPTSAVHPVSEAFGALAWGAKSVREQFELLGERRTDLLNEANLEQARRMAERVPTSMSIALVTPLLRFGRYVDVDVVVRFTEALPTERPGTLLSAVGELDKAGKLKDPQDGGVATGDFVDLVQAVRLGAPKVEHGGFDFAVSLLQAIDQVKAGRFGDAQRLIEVHRGDLEPTQKEAWVNALGELKGGMTDDTERSSLEWLLAEVYKC
ncbi:hypothetical protein MRQ36_01800 [Micromonospora sp. R77]|uniref:hypothetical protein n=1 Tax=Micromonospora sp. R77 TaxID=2925836 RepID=UPI001F6117F8|nr:hypothetical protein [Micromonospora sp. R77]MCI4061374.1 hypothetical protein [Micromonospora sp. R77]